MVVSPRDFQSSAGTDILAAESASRLTGGMSCFAVVNEETVAKRKSTTLEQPNGTATSLGLEARHGLTSDNRRRCKAAAVQGATLRSRLQLGRHVRADQTVRRKALGAEMLRDGLNLLQCHLRKVKSQSVGVSGTVPSYLTDADFKTFEVTRT